MNEIIRKGIEKEKKFLKAMYDEKVADFDEIENRFLGYLDALYDCGFINNINELANESTTFIKSLFE